MGLEKVLDLGEVPVQAVVQELEVLELALLLVLELFAFVAKHASHKLFINITSFQGLDEFRHVFQLVHVEHLQVVDSDLV